MTFKIKTGYYFELLTPETIKLLGSTENRTSKDKNGENINHLKITEVVLVDDDEERLVVCFLGILEGLVGTVKAWQSRASAVVQI